MHPSSTLSVYGRGKTMIIMGLRQGAGNSSYTSLGDFVNVKAQAPAIKNCNYSYSRHELVEGGGAMLGANMLTDSIFHSTFKKFA